MPQNKKRSSFKVEYDNLKNPMYFLTNAHYCERPRLLLRVQSSSRHCYYRAGDYCLCKALGRVLSTLAIP